MKNITTTLLAIFLLFGAVKAQHCSSDDRYSEVEVFSNAQISSDLEVTYGSAQDWQGSTQSLELDFFYPDTVIDAVNSKPFILLIHGGSFVAGDKSNLHYECAQFAKRGFVVATLEYRLGYNTGNPADQFNAIYRAEQDAHAAMRFITENATDYQIDTAWMFVGGSSAGSVTALNLNYVTETEWNAIVPSASGTNGGLYTSGNALTNTFTLKGIYNNWGSTTSSTMNANEMIPTMSFHGDADDVVDIDTTNMGIEVFGSRPIHLVLDQNNVCNDLTIQAGGGHGIYYDAAGTNFRVGKGSCFFKSLFCSSCTSITTFDYLPATCSTVGLEENKEDKISIYPNPFENKISIEGAKGNEFFTLTSLNGQVVYTGFNIQNQDFSSLESGIYYLSFSNDEGETRTEKLVKR